MKNFVAPGNTITAIAPEAVLSGQLVLVGAMAGVANSDAAAGAPVELSVEGDPRSGENAGGCDDGGLGGQGEDRHRHHRFWRNPKRGLGNPRRRGWHSYGQGQIGAGALKSENRAAAFAAGAATCMKYRA